MDSDQAKLFVGGISWETNEESLKEHFGKYGVVLESVIMRDRSTGNARGFGFVLFSDPSAADRALQEPKHVILGRTVEVKKAVPRGEQNHPQQQQQPQQQPQQQQQQQHPQQSRGPVCKNSSSGGASGNNSGNQFKNRKIFVGGLSANITEEDFRAYFEKYGRITDVVVMYDTVTHRPRGFGFITFDSDEAVESVLQKSFHELNDKRVEVKLAVPKDGSNGNSSNGGNSYNMRGGGGGRGSVFGSYPGGVFTQYPRYGLYHGYLPPPVSGYGNAAGYPFPGYPPMGAYDGVGYGAAPIMPPRSPWSSMGMYGARRSPTPYGNAAPYPGYVNGGVGGFMGMTGSAYRGVVGAANGKWNQGGAEAQTTAGAGYGGVPGTTPTRTDGGNLDDDASGFGGSYGAGAGNKQNQRGHDGQYRPYPNRVG
ncbi:heterogeneous nuclear ribonucleoprotein 1-like [Magnolia sinica]|uniref:heterogeneous nuclear ribonucleoprotein 1-like n=1 Tax=Magnolia sinica TaxID=86752 RepID=UPI002658276C|nr:heterogeneous nuclear ribonucleoprotein 1-like [Magnolia sinica]